MANSARWPACSSLRLPVTALVEIIAFGGVTAVEQYLLWWWGRFVESGYSFQPRHNFLINHAGRPAERWILARQFNGTCGTLTTPTRVIVLCCVAQDRLPVIWPSTLVIYFLAERNERHKAMRPCEIRSQRRARSQTSQSGPVAQEHYRGPLPAIAALFCRGRCAN